MSSNNPEVFGNIDLEEAKSKIEERLPYLLPQEETELVILDDQKETALYYGKWGNRHIIGLKSEKIHSASRKLTHELLHQRFAEVLGRDKVLEDFPDRFKSIDFDKLTGQEVCGLLNEERNRDPPQLSVELWSISETISFVGEKYIFEDKTPLRETIKEGGYPKEVLDKIFYYDDNTDFEEIPKLLETLTNSEA